MPPRQPQAPPSGATAVGTAAAPTVATSVGAGLSPALVTAVGGVLAAKTISALTGRIAKAIEDFADERFPDSIDFVATTLAAREGAPPRSLIDKILKQESRYEREFRRKMRERLERDLPRALSITDPNERMAAVNGIFAREKRFTFMREEAMFSRALGKIEAQLLERLSPRGAYWKLSPHVQQHTLDCLAMGEKFWPWAVLREWQPPLHAGCPCELLGLDEAIAAGLMTEDMVPEPGEATARFAKIRSDFEDLEHALLDQTYVVGGDGIDAADLIEAKKQASSGAMVALFPPKALARKLAVEGGEPAEDLHVTLVFLGEAAEIKDVEHLKTVVAGIAASAPPLAGEISGEGLFTAGPKPVRYASMDVPKLPEVRQRLVDALKAAGIFVAEDHGFTPHMTLAYDDREVDLSNDKLSFDRLVLAVGDRRWEFGFGADLEEAVYVRRGLHRPLRWAKGLVKGGQFRPERGGSSARVRTPVPPAKSGRARWEWIRGVYTKIPEARAWTRKVASHTYHSPPGTTAVYRDGRLIGAPQMPALASERHRHSPGVLPELDPAVAAVAEARRARAAERIKENLRSGRAPLERGDGADAVLALRDQGFRLRRSRGATLEFVKGESEVEVGFDGRAVTTVLWNTTPATTDKRKKSDGPPQDFEAFAADVLHWADEVGIRHGAEVSVPEIRTNSALSDHAGTHHWTGEVDLGRDVQPAIEAAASARAASRDLTDEESYGVYGAYWAAAHEAIGHGVNPIDPLLFTGADRNLEEILAEEVAHLYAVERLTEQRQTDVVRWRAQNPSAKVVLGVYRPGRHALAALLDQAGLVNERDRRDFLERLKFKTPPEIRIAELADAIAAATGRDFGEVADEVEASLRDPGHDPKTGERRADLPVDEDGIAPEHFRSVLNFARSPGHAQIGVSYGRFADGTLDESGHTLTLPSGARRRAERVEVPEPWRAAFGGETEMWAVSHYPAGYRMTDKAAYADGTAKNFRFVDDEARAKLILRAFAGKGSPGVDDDLLAEYVGELDAARDWAFVEGVPVKRRFDNSFGVGWYDDARVLSAIDGSEKAARVALMRSMTNPPWGPARRSPGAPDPRTEVIEWSGHEMPEPQEKRLRAWLDSLEGDGQFPHVSEVREGWIRVEGDGGDGWVTPDGQISYAPPAGPLTSPGTTGGLFDDFMADLPAPPASPGTWLDKFKGLWDEPVEEKPKKKKKPKRVFVGGVAGVRPDGTIPRYDATRLEVKKSAGGSNGAQWAFDKGGDRWLLKTYRGDEDRVATELLANAIYREMGAKVARAGSIDVGGKIAVTYPALDGEVRDNVFSKDGPSQQVGEHYMVDALLANWDFAGMTDDNIMWDPEGEPFRVDQGGTFEFRAMGGGKPYGPVPTEVWTMIRKGQGQRAAKVTEKGMAEQAGMIAATLTPGKVDELVDAAPFADDQMRERVRENLKARISWMDAFKKGLVDLPRPLENDAAREALARKEAGFDPMPEQEDALFGYMEGLHEEINGHLRSGRPVFDASKPVRRAIDELDSIIRAVKRTDEDMYAYVSLDLPDGEAVGEDLVGKTLRERGFLPATTDPAAGPGNVTLKLLIPEGSYLVHPQGLGYEDMPREPEIILARDAKLRIGERHKTERGVVLDVTVSTERPFKPWKPTKRPSGEKPEVPASPSDAEKAAQDFWSDWEKRGL